MINFTKFKIVSHRGLTNGPSKDLENNPDKIFENIRNYPFLTNEIDINLTEKGIFLGHDKPSYEIGIEFLLDNKNFLILHVKSVDSESKKVLTNLEKLTNNCHIFSHSEDPFTITNRGWIWSHPSQGIKPNTILVMPEKIVSFDNLNFNNELRVLMGVCTDYPLKMID